MDETPNKLKGMQYVRACIARWIIVYICIPISSIGVLTFCVDMTTLYHMNQQESEDDTIDQDS